MELESLEIEPSHAVSKKNTRQLEPGNEPGCGRSCTGTSHALQRNPGAQLYYAWYSREERNARQITDTTQWAMASPGYNVDLSPSLAVVSSEIRPMTIAVHSG